MQKSETSPLFFLSKYRAPSTPPAAPWDRFLQCREKQVSKRASEKQDHLRVVLCSAFPKAQLFPAQGRRFLSQGGAVSCCCHLLRRDIPGGKIPWCHRRPRCHRGLDVHRWGLRLVWWRGLGAEALCYWTCWSCLSWETSVQPTRVRSCVWLLLSVSSFSLME